MLTVIKLWLLGGGLGWLLFMLSGNYLWYVKRTRALMNAVWCLKRARVAFYSLLVIAPFSNVLCCAIIGPLSIVINVMTIWDRLHSGE